MLELDGVQAADGGSPGSDMANGNHAAEAVCDAAEAAGRAADAARHAAAAAGCAAEAVCHAAEAARQAAEAVCDAAEAARHAADAACHAAAAAGRAAEAVCHAAEAACDAEDAAAGKFTLRSVCSGILRIAVSLQQSAMAWFHITLLHLLPMLQSGARYTG
eukprot:gene12163-biopygen11581